MSGLEELVELLDPSRRTQVVDVGASQLHDAPPYKPLLDAGLCFVTGFDPQAEAMPKPGSNERYLPYAIGDGVKPHALNICTYPGWTSLLTPSKAALDCFTTFKEQAAVKRQTVVQTHRLDDLEEVEHIDFLKADAQGSELDVLRYGSNKLDDTAVIQVEVPFVGLYEHQPSFGDIDLELRAQGFLPHTFANLKRWPIDSALIIRDFRYQANQLLEADAVYVRDFIRHAALTSETLKHLCLIAHACYRSFDLAAHCIHLLERRGKVKDGRKRYADLLQLLSAKEENVRYLKRNV